MQFVFSDEAMRMSGHLNRAYSAGLVWKSSGALTSVHSLVVSACAQATAANLLASLRSARMLATRVTTVECGRLPLVAQEALQRGLELGTAAASTLVRGLALAEEL